MNGEIEALKDDFVCYIEHDFGTRLAECQTPEHLKEHAEMIAEAWAALDAAIRADERAAVRP